MRTGYLQKNSDALLSEPTLKQTPALVSRNQLKRNDIISQNDNIYVVDSIAPDRAPKTTILRGTVPFDLTPGHVETLNAGLTYRNVEDPETGVSMRIPDWGDSEAVPYYNVQAVFEMRADKSSVAQDMVEKARGDEGAAPAAVSDEVPFSVAEGETPNAELEALVLDKSRPRTAEDALNLIVKGGGKFASLAQDLLTQGSPEGLAARIGVKSESAKQPNRSHYFPGKHRIEMSARAAGSERVVIHEVVHALTSRKLDRAVGAGAKEGKA